MDKFPNLRGTPYVSRMIKYRPIEFADKLKVPTLIIDVAREELFDIKTNGGLLYERVKNKLPAEYHVVSELTHYGIYTTGRKEATDLAISWFDKHLKVAGRR